MTAARTLLFAVGAFALAAGGAHAGGWGGRYGVASDRTEERAWSYERTGPAPPCPCRAAAEVPLPASFFEGDQGVGPWPDFVEGGGGGGFVAAGGEATASASASASVRISIRSHAEVHHGGHGGRRCK